MNKFTDVRWKFNNVDHKRRWVTVEITESGTPVANIEAYKQPFLIDPDSTEDIDAMANLELMRAAPELKAALEKLLERYLSAMHSEFDGADWTEDTDEAVGLARDAIAMSGQWWE